MSAYRPQPRLTLKELQSIMEFYHSKFPSWRVVREDTLIRETGPVVQGITFDRLSYGVYRPTGHIRVLIAPEDSWGFELPQFLIKPREIDRRQDREFRDRVVEAIREQFIPSVDDPLIPEEVLERYEQEANPPRSSDAYSLAALNAYLGHDERALYWCSRFKDLVDASGRQLQDFDRKQQTFLDSLEGWIKTGDAKQQLEQVLQGERRKWGLVV